jgi:hypothetical protein
LKHRALILLLILLLVQTPFAMSNEPSPTTPKSEPEIEYGIDSNAMYPGSLVEELLKIAQEEATMAIEEAYARGYKAGRIDAASSWLPVWNDLKVKESNRQRITIVTGAISFTLGVFATAGMAALVR